MGAMDSMAAAVEALVTALNQAQALLAAEQASINAAREEADRELSKGSVAKTSVCSTLRKGTSVHVDFDSEGRLLGIELLGARALLGDDVIAKCDFD